MLICEKFLVYFPTKNSTWRYAIMCSNMLKMCLLYCII